MVWLFGVGLLSLRTLGGWLYLRRLIARAKPVSVPGFAGMLARLGIRRAVEVRTTLRADSPFTAAGSIVLPLAMWTGLPPAQLEAILLHELAHIRRGDYVAEWLLQVLETVFFYHPVAWWLASALRREREQCCDDDAVAAGADAGAFAAALLHMEEMRVPALANGGAGADLGSRIGRLLGRPAARSPWPAMLAVLIAATGLLTPLMTAQPAGSPYQRWVEQDVVYIIQPEEKKAYLALHTDEERDMFIGQFWQRREPKSKEEHYRRIAYANERYREPNVPGWTTERGRTYIVYGPADEVEVHTDLAYEQWYYKKIPGVGNNVIFEFGSRRGRK
jgi:GWxTD domain-containing protein